MKRTHKIIRNNSKVADATETAFNSQTFPKAEDISNK